MSALLCLGQQASVFMSWWIGNCSSGCTPSSLPHEHMMGHIHGVIPSPLRIIALPALGVNSLCQGETIQTWSCNKRHTAFRRSSGENDTLQSLNHLLPWASADFCSSYPSDDWLTPALNSWELNESRQKYWANERQIDDYVFLWMPPGVSLI